MSKKFNLQGAKQGAPICTNDGRFAKILYCDSQYSVNDVSYPIVAEVRLSNGAVGMIRAKADGTSLRGDARNNLVMRDDDWEERLARGEYGPRQEAKQPQNDADKAVRDTIPEIMTILGKYAEKASIRERLDYLACMIAAVEAQVGVIYKYILSEKARK